MHAFSADLTPSFPAHFRLMLLAARDRPTEEEVASMRDVIAGEHGLFAWSNLLAVSANHRVSSLVRASLRQMPAGSVPEPVLADLDDKHRRNAAHAKRLALETARISTHFNRAGISLVALKGVLLSQSAYGDAALRHAGDLDLLTPSPDLERQVELMRALGYSVLHPPDRLTPARLRSYRRFWKDLTFQHAALGLHVDLHWRLFNSTRHPANRLITQPRTAEIKVFGIPLRGLHPEDQCLYAAAHGLSDQWVYLKSLADVATFSRRELPLAHAALWQRAAACGLSAQLSSAFHLASEWMGASKQLSVHAPFHGELRRSVFHRLQKTEWRPVREAKAPLAALRWELALVPGWRTGAEMIGRYLYRPRLWSLLDLPDRFFWLYPVLGALLLPRSQPSHTREAGSKIL